MHLYQRQQCRANSARTFDTDFTSNAMSAKIEIGDHFTFLHEIWSVSETVKISVSFILIRSSSPCCLFGQYYEQHYFSDSGEWQDYRECRQKMGFHYREALPTPAPCKTLYIYNVGFLQGRKFLVVKLCPPACSLPTAKSYFVQSGASYVSQGSEDYVLRSSPGWLADIVATYCSFTYFFLYKLAIPTIFSPITHLIWWKL